MGASAEAERRHVPRRPFRGTVELAMPEDPEAYEADGVDLSIGGMALRTSLLPDKGSELACKFKLEDGRRVMARGEVVWAQDAGSDAGEFGLRFTELNNLDEDAIRDSFAADAAAEDAAVVAPGEPAKARLHIPGMNAPLRARIRTEMDDAIVLGSDLSFLKLGESIEVERQEGKRERGRIEDVSVEVDAETHIARLMLTVTLSPASRTARHAALAAPVEAPAPMPLAKRRGAQATAVLTPPPVETMHVPDEDDMLEAAPGADDVGGHASMDDADADALTSAKPAVRTPPAWLVSALAAMRTAGRALATKAGPSVTRLVKTVVAFVMLAYAKIRGRINGTPVEVEAPRPSSGRRPQIAPSAQAETAVATSGRKKIGLYALAGAGVVAIAVAVGTSGRDPRPHTPRPQVAVAPVNEAPAEPAADPNAVAANGVVDPNATAVDPNAAMQGEPPAGANGPVGGPSDIAPEPAPRSRSLPTDLMAAAHSRNANVDTERPTIRGATHRGPVAAPAPVVARAVAPPPRAAAPVNAPVSHTLGSPLVRTGTVLRMRMDGAIAGMTGGPGLGNTIVIRMPGRHALDLAAPLVRQDARLVNAGVYNRSTGAELTLRFRDGVPQFQARTRGNTLEIVLAPAPARRPLANAHRR